MICVSDYSDIFYSSHYGDAYSFFPTYGIGGTASQKCVWPIMPQ